MTKPQQELKQFVDDFKSLLQQYPKPPKQLDARRPVRRDPLSPIQYAMRRVKLDANGSVKE